jgi:hypothetical protein
MGTAVSTETLVVTYDTAKCHNTVGYNPKHNLYRVLTEAANGDGCEYQKAEHVASPVVTGTLYLAPSIRSLFI